MLNLGKNYNEEYYLYGHKVSTYRLPISYKGGKNNNSDNTVENEAMV